MDITFKIILNSLVLYVPNSSESNTSSIFCFREKVFLLSLSLSLSLSLTTFVVREES
jgi:hypothetical protein